MAITFGSLFAGIGGADLGLERAGMTCVWQVEISDYCRRVLAKHWPGVRRHDDARTFPPTDPGEWRVDLVVGGDPCQGNSNAGSVHGRRHEDLGRELVRVVDALRPAIVLRENPYPHRPDALWPWWRMRSALEGVGYAVVPFRLRSCCLGGGHVRDRVWLLGHRADADRIRLEGIDRQGQPPGHAGRAGGDPRRRRQDGLPAPRVCRGRDEVPGLVDRLRGLGNAIDPVCAEWIGRLIIDSLEG